MNILKEFPRGEYAEGYPWVIAKDYVVTSHNRDLIGRCQHCRELSPEDPQWFTGSFPSDYQFLLPFAVVAWNQGHDDCTIVCLGCILDGAFKIGAGNR